MYTEYKNAAMVTGILPEAYIQNTASALTDAGHDVMRWQARGSLKDNRWYRKLFPAISPEKGVVRVLAAAHEVDAVMKIIIEEGKLHRQGTGAVFSMPCEELYIGGYFQTSFKDSGDSSKTKTHDVKENLDVIQCIVEKEQSDQIARAAINAGAHGPIVHYGEGRGLRDRLGWLRITKQQEKEVLTVIVDQADAEGIFNAMASAGNLDLPGRGYMYQMAVEKGLFNLPSHFDNNQNQANTRQIIGAIDHLMGHDHWRDQTVFSVGNSGKSAGLSFLKRKASNIGLEDQHCLTIMVDRQHAEYVMDMMLDSGAPGLNSNYCQYVTTNNQCIHEGVQLVSEYGIIKCVASEAVTQNIIANVKRQTAEQNVEDICIFLQPVSKVMTYIHHPQPEKRRTSTERSLAY